MIEKRKEYLDKKGIGGAILMDLSKAFVILNHDMPLEICYGFDKNQLLIIKSYLKNDEKEPQLIIRSAHGQN